MATTAQIIANRANAHHSTGPNTAAGKQQSSANALTHGLFSMHDLVRPDEQDEYDRFVAAYRNDLSPRGAMQETFAAAIIGASWRMRRCSLVEAAMAENLAVDPMAAGPDSAGARMQRSVDRARSQAFNILRRSTTELRRLQTDRAIAALITAKSDQSRNSGVIDYSAFTRSLNKRPPSPSAGSSSAGLASFCISPSEPPRSAQFDASGSAR
jgi:hypothetical protein